VFAASLVRPNRRPFMSDPLVSMSSVAVITRHAHFTVGWFDFASMAVLIYDYFLTLDAETRFVWRSSWNIGKVLFILTRYTAFLDTSIVLFVATYQPKSLDICPPLYGIAGWMEVIGITIAEIILVLRTWVIWDRSRWILISLACLLTAVGITEGVFVQIFINSIQCLSFLSLFISV